MPMAASGAWAMIGTVLVEQPDVAQPEQEARPVRRALEDRVVDLHLEVGKFAVDGRLDGRNQALERDRAAGKPSIAQNDGDQSEHQDPGKNLAANMRAVRREFLDLDLDRLGDALDQRATSAGQRQDHLATVGGQLDEGPRDRLGRLARGAVVRIGLGPQPSARLYGGAQRQSLYLSAECLRLCAQCHDRPATLGGQPDERAGHRLVHPSMAPSWPGPRRTHRRPASNRTGNQRADGVALDYEAMPWSAHGLVSASPKSALGPLQPRLPGARRKG